MCHWRRESLCHRRRCLAVCFRRDGEGVRVFWDRLRDPSFISRWNPFATDFPFTTFTYHPVRNISDKFSALCDVSASISDYNRHYSISSWFFFLSSSMLYYLFLCMPKVLKDKKKKSAPTSNRKQCSWKASSVAPPLIRWLCDITLCHHVTHLHYLFLYSQ